MQGQDWDFVAHTFWLKHGVAMLFDSLYMSDGVTLAYNSGKQGNYTSNAWCIMPFCVAIPTAILLAAAHLPSLFGSAAEPGLPANLAPDAELPSNKVSAALPGWVHSCILPWGTLLL